MTDIIDRFAGASPFKGMKNPCRVATTANITLSGTQTIDSVAVVADDRVLVKDQTEETENGVYLVSSGAWTRTKDFDGNNDIVTGTLVPLQDGSLYRVTTANPITIDTDDIEFEIIGVSEGNAILAGLAAMGTGTGVVVQTGDDTFVKRTITGTSNQVVVTNGDGVSGAPTLSLDATLVALAALDSTAGIVTQTGADTFVRRTLAAPAAGFTITNPAGTAGNPTFVLADDLAGLEGMSGTGLVARTASNTYAQRTLTGTSLQITVTNGDGVSGNPTLSFPTNFAAGGESHTISGGIDNTIIGGSTNEISAGLYNTIAGGNASTISAGSNGTIIGGGDHAISASGTGYNTIAGGNAHTISTSATYSTLMGGIANAIGTAASAAIVGGESNSIQTGSSDSSFIGGGESNTITSTGDRNAAIGGTGNTISGNAVDCAIIAGNSNTITTGAVGATAQGWQCSVDKHGQAAHSAGAFSVIGDAQSSRFVLRRQTTNSTPAELFLNGSTLRMTIASDSTWGFDIMVVARRTDADNESAFYRFEGCIDNNAGTTALVGSVVAATPIEDTAAWACAVTADDTNDALVITVTGENSKTINWVAYVTTVEVKG